MVYRRGSETLWIVWCVPSVPGGLRNYYVKPSMVFILFTILDNKMEVHFGNLCQCDFIKPFLLTLIIILYSFSSTKNIFRSSRKHPTVELGLLLS